jgi:hypothetical protein
LIGMGMDGLKSLLGLSQPIVEFVINFSLNKWVVSPEIDDVRKQVQETIDDLL